MVIICSNNYCYYDRYAVAIYNVCVSTRAETERINVSKANACTARYFGHRNYA